MLSYVKTRRTQGTNAFLAREHATHINAQKEFSFLKGSLRNAFISRSALKG
jgi:hypothetical protein